MEPAHTETINAEIVPYARTENTVPQHVRPSIFDLEPEEQVAKATQIANALCKVIDKQKLFTTIQGKKHVRVEGWELLGTFLGVLPKEVGVTEHADGSFEARVELVRASNGVTVGGASALCGMDETRWAKADRYARRSMATTRAIGKAYRTSFSWIINLAGYEVTPAEEMPRNGEESKSRQATSGPATATNSNKQVRLYTGTTQEQEAVQAILKKNNIPEEAWIKFHDNLLNKPGFELPNLIKEYRAHVAAVGEKENHTIDAAGEIPLGSSEYDGVLGSNSQERA